MDCSTACSGVDSRSQERWCVAFGSFLVHMFVGGFSTYVCDAPVFRPLKVDYHTYVCACVVSLATYSHPWMLTCIL